MSIDKELIVIAKNLHPVYGGNIFLVTYLLKTKQEGIRNAYHVTAQVRGIENADPYMDVYEIEALTDNMHTLGYDAIKDLLGW
jgi:hypothetical protein